MKTIFLLAIMVTFFMGMLRYEIIDGQIKRAVSEFGFVASSILLGAVGIVVFLTYDSTATMAERYVEVVDMTIIAGIALFSVIMWLEFYELIMADEEGVLKRTSLVLGAVVFSFGSWVVAERLQQAVRLEDFTEFGVIFVGVVSTIVYIVILHRASVIGGNLRALWLEKTFPEDITTKDVIKRRREFEIPRV